MKFLIILLGCLFVYSCEAKSDNPIKVAIIDTGANVSKITKFCKKFDLTRTSVKDRHGHGTNISNTIKEVTTEAGVEDSYCEMPIKYYAENTNTTHNSLVAINLAIRENVDIINYSGGGVEKSEAECKAVVKALDAGIIFVAAAGNNGNDLDEEPYYPAACDPRVTVVGCSNLENSNYGPVDYTYPCVKKGKPSMSGTSQATAIRTGKELVKIIKGRKR